MATLWPEKTIVGIDRNSAAIACANELAERHGLTNASFIEGDISETGSLDQILGADIYLAAWVTHEWFETTWRDSGENAEKGRETFSIDDISPHICESPKSLELIASQMNDVGSLITVNRFPRFEQSLSFHRLAELSGLQIKFPDSDVLNIETESGIEEFPIFSYRKSNEAVKPLPSETLYSLVNYQELKKRFCNKSFDDAAAEAIMALSDMRINVCTLTKKYPEDNAEEKIILALNDMFVITFHTTNLNFRSCRLAPACALDEMLQYVLEVAENTPESVESSFEFKSKVLDEAIINAFLFQPSELEAAFGNE